jgi:hypothetical protein
MANTYIKNKNTIILLAIVLVLVYLAKMLTKKEGFYLSFFPPTPSRSCDTDECRRTTIVDDRDVQAKGQMVYGNKQIAFNFPPDTPREAMVTYVGKFFRSKLGGTYQNVIDVKVERKGPGNGDFYPQSALTDLVNRITDVDYDKVFLIVGHVEKDSYKYTDYGTSNRMKYITAPQNMKYERIPLEFSGNSVVIRLDKKDTPMPVMYFMHYWFDTFYCQGKYEKELNVVGVNQKDNASENIHKYVVDVGNMDDCKWGSDNSKVQTCKIYDDKELQPDAIHVEPDSDARNRGYKTPMKTYNRCDAEGVYFKKWDARGVPIERTQRDIEMKEYIYHPGLVQNKLDGLYDDVFDMSRIIPSFPTGKASSGR